MASGVYIWSRTASTNSGSDSAINWAEGQAPSSVNDSARAMMASVAKYRDDISGAIVTGGTSTAYTVTSYQTFDTLAHMANSLIAFTPHATNAATVTLNVDGLGAKPLRTSTGVELLAGMLIAGTPYMATYNNSDAVFYLAGFFGNPYNVPLGSGMDYWGSTAPNSSFAFPIGQAISRTTYASLFSIVGTTYGTGDGSTTFNLPDKTGRASVMKEATATRLTSNYFGGDSTALGAVGGAENVTLTRANLPNTSVTVAITDPGHTHDVLGNATSNSPSTGPQFVGSGAPNFTATLAARLNTTGISAAFNLNGNTTQTLPRTVQPTIVCNYIMRII